MVRHEKLDLRSRQHVAEQDRPVRGRAVLPEHILCQVDADKPNFLLGLLRHRWGESGLHPISEALNLFCGARQHIETNSAQTICAPSLDAGKAPAYHKTTVGGVSP